MDFMSKENISFFPHKGNRHGYDKVVEDVINRLNKEK